MLDLDLDPADVCVCGYRRDTHGTNPHACASFEHAAFLNDVTTLTDGEGTQASLDQGGAGMADEYGLTQLTDAQLADLVGHVVARQRPKELTAEIRYGLLYEILVRFRRLTGTARNAS